MSAAGRMFQVAILVVLAVACAGQGSGTGRGGDGESLTVVDRKIGVTGERERRYAPGEVLVKFRDGTDAGTIARIQREVHLETVRVVSSPNLFLMRIVDQTSVEETVQRLQMYDEVVLAEPNYVRRIQ
jgi:Fervidolysin N-terminal prodomain